MSSPRFSIVIPTRERAETLRAALRTCLDQSHDDYEIIVSDNFSSPATKAAVDEAGSSRVRYFRTDRPLAMSDNWEFAVAQARGEYVLLIGDDDGLLPHCLHELERIIGWTRARAVRWSAAFYTWPSFAIPGQGDYLRLPLGTGLADRDGAAAIREVITFREFYTALPMLYNAAVHRDVLDDLRTRVGRVFPHPVPDVYSGFAIAYAAGRYVSTEVPMTVSGQSGASNGIATLFNRGRNEIGREFFALNAAADLHSEPTVPDVPAFPHVPVADSFAYAKRKLFPALAVEINRRELTTACMAGMRVTEADWPAAVAAVRDSLRDDPALLRWFDAEHAGTPFTPRPPVQMRPPQLGFDGVALNLDAAAFGVRDVAGAARLCEHLLGYRERPVNYTATEDDRHVAAVKIADLGYLCDERERAILRLHLASAEIERRARAAETRAEALQTACEERLVVIENLNRSVQEHSRLLQESQAEVWALKAAAASHWSMRWPVRTAYRCYVTTRSAAHRVLRAVGLRRGV